MRPAGEQHSWTYVAYSDAWQCKRCAAVARTRERKAARSLEKCAGFNSDMRKVLFAGMGHSLRSYLICDSEMPLISCTQCGAVATQGARNLLRKCPGVPPSNCLRACRNRIARGLHPTKPSRLSLGVFINDDTITAMRAAAG